MSDVRVSQISFNTVASLVIVSAISFNTAASLTDVRVSQLSFNTVAAVAPEIQQDSFGGGGDWYRHYKHPNEFKKYRKPIAAEIREMYEAMVEVAAPIELAKINAVIAEYVEKPSKNSANVQLIISPPSIDWVALAKDIEQVYALARIYDRLLVEYEDEAAFLLLM